MRTLYFAFLTLLLTGCGGGSSDSSSSSAGASLTGVLVDSAVEGIGYRTETKNGFTNAKGEFNYAPGETITFFIGDLELPPVAAKAVITPLDIAGTDEIDNQAAVNISILLQSLDMDADPSNGIRIDYEELKTVAEEVDFEQPIDNFSTAIGNLASAAGNSVVSEIKAVEHLQSTLKTLEIGFSSKSASSLSPVSSAKSSSSAVAIISSSVNSVSSNINNSIIAASSATVSSKSSVVSVASIASSITSSIVANSSVTSSRSSVLASSSRVSSSSRSSVQLSSASSVSRVSSLSSSRMSSRASSASSVWTQGVNDKGFTVIKPSADSKIIYVSNSEGNDANDCLSAEKPCKTIAAGRNKMRAGFPDHLYLRRGDVWRNQLLERFPSGRSVNEPAVIAFYGEKGDRPKLENSSPSSIGRGDVQFIHIIGLEFSAYKMDPEDPEFTGSNKANILMINNHRDLLFEDNKFDHVEVVVHDFTDDDGNTFTPRNITLRRNIWTGAYYNQTSYHRDIRPSNIYAKVEDNLSLIENVFDYGGWHPDVIGASANMYNHNIYLQGGATVKTLVKGNIVTRGSSHGIQMRSGGLAENNFFGRNAVSLSIGYEIKPMAPGTQAHAIDNVISEGMSMVKGINPCQNNTEANLCTPAVFGIDLNTRASTGINWLAKNNIVSLLGPDDGAWRSLWNNLNFNPYQSYALEVPASNNIIWKWSLNPEEPVNNYPDPDRTLADYNAHLGGEQSFEAFMEVVLNRPLQTWDEKYSAYAINDYIRAGFGISKN